jgi:hypothetical protein
MSGKGVYQYLTRASSPNSREQNRPHKKTEQKG